MSLALAAFCIPAGAKSTTLSDFVDKVASSLVTFNYSFSTQAQKAKMTGKGVAKIQGDSFYTEGNGLEVWCDGKTRWTIDRISEEAVIESVEASGDSYATNPALLIASVDDAFTEISFGTTKFGSQVVDGSVLNPVSKGSSSMGIAQLTLFFKSGTSTLVGARVKLNDGTVSDFTISGLKFQTRNEKESFRFNEKTLDNSFVVTDLR